MILLALLAACAGVFTDGRQFAGTVRDGSGAAIGQARVLVRHASGADVEATTTPDGRFSLAAAPGAVLLIVRAAGFAEHRQVLPPGGPPGPLDIVLSPAAVSETVVVTAARVEQRAADVAASVTVVGRDAIAGSAAAVADDVLRQVPTFSLFRRSSSLASHPTSQGVSLRGVGPSGVSRTLVLFDGIPFNDPFGGWVYWTRVPLGSVERIEVVDGASSSLYGNYALGGVINVVTRAAAPLHLELRSQYANRNTPKLDVGAGHSWGALRVTFDGTLFRTSGYPVVSAGERGAVDTRAAVAFASATVKLRYAFSPRAHAFARAWHFRENRDNGKVSTIDGAAEANDTRWTAASVGAAFRLPDDSDLRLSLFADDVRFTSNFLAVPAADPPRSVGRMSLEQAVPTRGIGGSAEWARAVGRRHLLTAGFDWRAVEGESREAALDFQTGTRITLERKSGGAQKSAGLFVQDLFSPVERLVVTIAARVDHWRNHDGHNLERSVPGRIPTANDRPLLPERRDTVFSPRLSAIHHATGWFSAWGSIGTGFRAPTLNELYRQFRVGAVTTLANHDLGPERLLGTEAGVRLTPGRGITSRTTWFDNRVSGPVSNVTVSTAGTAVLQQRQNLGRTRIRGIQTDFEYRVNARFRFSGAYVFSHATVRAFDANPSLVGRFLPQVPRHRATVQAAYTNPDWLNVSVSLQATGRQFDDDQNLRGVPGRTQPGLPGYLVVDGSLSKRLSRRTEIFGGAQNLFDRTLFVGTLPTTLGAGRTIHAGVVVRLGSR